MREGCSGLFGTGHDGRTAGRRGAVTSSFTCIWAKPMTPTRYDFCSDPLNSRLPEKNVGARFVRHDGALAPFFAWSKAIALEDTKRLRDVGMVGANRPDRRPPPKAAQTRAAITCA